MKRQIIIHENFETVYTNDKKQSGITLIALVVTIVVLLILAGISLNLVIGNNGIITKAQDAKLMSRAGSAEDEVNLWKNDTYIGRTAGLETTNKEVMLQGLKDKKLVYEEEIDRDNEIITIKKKDGTIVKEISYGNIVINISKTPETEKAGAVLLKVTSIEGISTIKTEEEYNTFIEELLLMDDNSKKERIKQLEIVCMNTIGVKFNTLEEVIQYYYENDRISENTEEAFMNEIVGNDLNEYLCKQVDFLLGYYSTDEIIRAYIINPVGKISDSYIATENGTYTFTITDIFTGKEYQKSVEVTNIDKNLPIPQYYYVDNFDYNSIGLLEEDTDEPTTFETAFIIYNGETIDITSLIEISEDDSYNYFGGWDVANYLEDIGKASSRYDVSGIRHIIITKDGVPYEGDAEITWDE